MQGNNDSRYVCISTTHLRPLHTILSRMASGACSQCESTVCYPPIFSHILSHLFIILNSIYLILFLLPTRFFIFFFFFFLFFSSCSPAASSSLYIYTFQVVELHSLDSSSHFNGLLHFLFYFFFHFSPLLPTHGVKFLTMNHITRRRQRRPTERYAKIKIGRVCIQSE